MIQIPAIFHGTYAAVNKRMKPLARKFRTDHRLMEEDFLLRLDPAADSSLIVLEGPSKIVDGENRFHLFVLGKAIDEAFDPEQVPPDALSSLFTFLIQHEWGILLLATSKHLTIAKSPGEEDQLLLKWVQLSDKLTGMGAVFSLGTLPPKPILEYPLPLYWILGRRGMDSVNLKEWFVNGKLPELIRLHLRERGVEV